MAVKMKLTAYTPPASLPTRTLIPYRTEKSLRWSLFVLHRTESSTAFALDCYLPNDVPSIAFNKPLHHLTATFKIPKEKVTTVKAPHSDLGDGDFFWFVHTALSRHSLTDTEADATADFLCAKRLIDDLADAAVQAEETSIRHLMDEDTSLDERFHALFEAACADIEPPKRILSQNDQKTYCSA